MLRSRRSQRVFDEQFPLGTIERDALYEAVRLSPSSCNRQAIVIQIAFPASLRVLERLLVGGKGWLDGASLGFLLFADMAAYKSPAEVDYMPYLDAGCVVENLYLAAEALGLGACFVNPNIREEDRETFQKQFNLKGLCFCGLMAFGHYDVRAPESPKRVVEDLFY